MNDAVEHIVGIKEKLTYLVPTVCMFSLITAIPTAFGVDLISEGKVGLPSGGGVFGPVALAVLAMMRRLHEKARGQCRLSRHEETETD